MLTLQTRAKVLSVISFYAATTVGFASVNTASIQIINSVRPIFLSALVIVSIYCIFLERRIQDVAISILLFVIFFLVGTLSAISKFESDVLKDYITIHFGITIFGIYVVSLSMNRVNFSSINRGLIAYKIASLITLISVGAISLSIPPQFNFDLLSQTGYVRNYSQGITKFFGVASILCILHLRKNFFRGIEIWYVSMAAAFFFLSFIGGARGDFVAVLFIVVIIMVAAGWRGIIAILALSLTFGALILTHLTFLVENFVMVERLLRIIDGNFGQRDSLATSAVFMLGAEPRCFWIGCGFTSFQNYFEYEHGLYPHNYFLEMSITWGVPATLFLTLTCVLGILRDIKNERVSDVIYIYMYFLLVSLKSGELLASWMTTSFIFYFSGRGLASGIQSRPS